MRNFRVLIGGLALAALAAAGCVSGSDVGGGNANGNAGGAARVQINQAENLLTRGVDALIAAPLNGEVAASIVEAAHRQGVPVISYDRLIKNSDVDLYVSHQVVKIGEMQAKYPLEHLSADAPKPANFIIVQGSETDNNAKLLHDGQ